MLFFRPRKERFAIAASNEWIEYHLTPRGWEEGSRKDDGQPIKERPIPPDRVKSAKDIEYQAHGLADVEQSIEITFRSDDRAQVQALTEKFGSFAEYVGYKEVEW